MIIKVINFILKRFWGSIMEKIIAKVIEKLLSQMSDSLRKTIIEEVKRLDEVAIKTQNPWDDILVLMLKVALGID